MGHQHDIVGFSPIDWRYSTAPRGLAEVDLDVREPFPVESPGLPDCDFDKGRRVQSVTREPISSGFTSPVAGIAGDVVMEDEDPLPPLPTSTSSMSGRPKEILLSISDHGQLPARIMASTELEQPMTKMHLSHVDSWLSGVLQNPPNARREQRMPLKSARSRNSASQGLGDVKMAVEGDRPEIVLSTPAKAAAVSAKLKRDQLGHGVRIVDNEENGGAGSHEASSALRCTTPTANLLSVPVVQVTPSPGFPHGSPPPSPVQPTELPQAPPFQRVDASGSPFPILKGKSPQPMGMSAVYHQWQGYYSSPPEEQFASPPQQALTSPQYPQQYPMIHPSLQQNPAFYPGLQKYHRDKSPVSRHQFLEPSITYNRSPPPIPNSQQFIYLNGPPSPTVQQGASCSQATGQPRYSFSTAAAAHLGSSPAPDSRIRNAYRTDTLTPFEIPTTRFRKIGLGATAQSQGVRKLYPAGGVNNAISGGPGISRTATGTRRPLHTLEPRNGLTRAVTSGAKKYHTHASTRAAKSRSPQEEKIRSSPPNSSRGTQLAPRRKKLRRSLSGEVLVTALEEKDKDRICDIRGGQGQEKERRVGTVDAGIEDAAAIGGTLATRSAEMNDKVMVLIGDDQEGAGANDDGDDGTSSIGAVCGNDRTLIRKNMSSITPEHDMIDVSSSKRGQKLQNDDGKGAGKEDASGDEEIRKLSPYVTPYRKGKGWKVREDERRPSYWDGDILPGAKGERRWKGYEEE